MEYDIFSYICFIVRVNGIFLCGQVEIVMGLEEEFGICVEEESAQSISTVQEAADLIEELLEKKWRNQSGF